MTTTVPASVAPKVITGSAFGVLMMTLFGGVWLAWGLQNLRGRAAAGFCAGAPTTGGADLNATCRQKTKPCPEPDRAVDSVVCAGAT